MQSNCHSRDVNSYEAQDSTPSNMCLLTTAELYYAAVTTSAGTLSFHKNKEIQEVGFKYAQPVSPNCI
jgi:hypothetical protein